MRLRIWLPAAALFFSVLAVGVLFARPAPESYDAQIMFQVTQSMVDHAGFTVGHDVFGTNSPYSSFSLGMSLLMAPPYWLAERLSQDPGPWVMSVNAVVVAAVALVVFLLGLETGATSRQSLAAALLTVFGTLLLPYVATGFSEPAVALAIALGVLGVQMRRPALVGGAAGLAMLMRIDSVVLVVPILALAAWQAGGRSWAAALRFGTALLPAIVVIGAYNSLRFGAPWRVGYAGQTFNHPILAGLYGLLFSPAAGVFLYVPPLLLALVGMVLASRRMPLLTATAVVLLAIRVPFYATWHDWSAYWVWGPRHLVPAMPAHAIGFLELVRRWPQLKPLVKIGVTALLALGVSVQVVGAAVAYEHATMFAALKRAHPAVEGPGYVADATLPSTQAVHDQVYFDWSFWPIPDEARDLVQGRFLASRWLTPTPNVPAVVVLVTAAVVSMSAAILATDRRRDWRPARRRSDLWAPPDDSSPP